MTMCRDAVLIGSDHIFACYNFIYLECEDLFASLDHVLNVIFYPGGLRRVSRPLDQATGEAHQDQLSSGDYELHKIELQ